MWTRFQEREDGQLGARIKQHVPNLAQWPKTRSYTYGPASIPSKAQPLRDSRLKTKEPIATLCGLSGVEALELAYSTAVYLSALELHADVPAHSPVRCDIPDTLTP